MGPTRSLRVALLAGSAAGVLAGAAHAQGAAPERPAADDRVAVEEVIVTSQRRSENLQNVPISVTALTASQLASAGVANSQNLVQVTPGLVIIRSSYSGQPAIRGVSTRNAGPGDEPNVASYVDGVYQPEQFGTIQELANVERVEVLKGPQGTLFGRNATGGAISIVTKRPTATPEGELSVSAGKFGYAKVSAYLSGPLHGDVLTASLAGFYLKDDGYIRNVFLNTTQGDQERYAVRGKLLYAPNDRFELGLNGFYANGNENATFSGHSLNGNNQARRSANPRNLPLNILIPQGDYETATDFIPYLKIRLASVDMNGKADLGWATLSGLVSYSDSRAHIYSDADVSPLVLSYINPTLTSESSTQELVLTSNPGRLTWLLGLNGYQGKSYQNPMIANGVANYNGQKSSAAAGFAEVSYEVVDRLFLTAGLRYSYDKKKGSFRLATSPTATTGQDSWTNVAPRVVARYEFSSRGNVYASYTEGFKTGTFNTTSAAGAQAAARPEKVKAFEVGVKADLMANLRVVAAAFHYNYTDLQTTVTLTQPNGALFSLLQNAPEARIDGFEGNVQWQATRDLELTAGVSLLKAEVQEFPNATLSIPLFVGGLPAGNTTGVFNVAGRDLLRAPRSTLNLGINYSREVAGGDLVFTGNAFFSDKWYNDLLNRVTQPSYTVVNASVTWTAPGDHWSVSVFGQNLTDERYFLSTVTSSLSDTFGYQKPRWFGATVGYRF